MDDNQDEEKEGEEADNQQIDLQRSIFAVNRQLYTATDEHLAACITIIETQGTMGRSPCNATKVTKRSRDSARKRYRNQTGPREDIQNL